MLKLFRINDPYRIILVLLILLLIRVTWVIVGMPMSVPLMKWLVLGERLGYGFTMYSEAFDYTAPLSALVYKWLDIVFGASRWTHVVFSGILIVAQAWIFNSTLLRNKVYEENTYIPAFLYMIIASGVMDFWALTPQLMCVTFLLLAVNQIFRRIDNVVTDELFLYSGIYVGLATFFYLPSIIFFAVFLISFIGFSSAVPRRILLYVYGFSVVFLINWAYFFWFGAASEFFLIFFDFFRPTIFYLNYMELLGSGAVLAGILLISLTTLLHARFTNFQQKTIQVMILLLIGAFVSSLLSKDVSGSGLILYAPTISFMLTHYFLHLRKRWLKMIMPTLIIIGTLVFPYFSLKHLSESPLFFKQRYAAYESKKIMVIGDDLSIYEKNLMASPFIDKYASMQSLQSLDYYKQAADLYLVLRKSDPDVIVDDFGFMPKIQDRFPYFSKYYRKGTTGDYIKISN